MDTSVALALWTKFEGLQKLADRRRLDHRAWAIDEGIDQLLVRLQGVDPGLPPLTIADVEALPGGFNAVVTNRRKKHRRRRAILINEFPWKVGRRVVDPAKPSSSVIAAGRHDSATRLHQRIQIELVQKNTSGDEFELLLQIAKGEGYGELARTQNRPVGTLKSEVARCRRRLRGAVPD